MSENASRLTTADERPLLRRRVRRGAGIDLTPMVDVAFLLIIFFMVTTVFQRPLAMEINMPEPDATVEVPESNVLTVLVDADESLFAQLGSEPLIPTPWSDLQQLFVDRTAANPDLIILVKIHRDARYESMVEMMDLLDDAQMQRFSLVPLGEADLEKLQALR